MLAIELSPEIEDRLALAADRAGVSAGEIAREAILSHLEVIDDLAAGEQALLDIRAGHSPTFSLSEVERDLGLDH